MPYVSFNCPGTDFIVPIDECLKGCKHPRPINIYGKIACLSLPTLAKIAEQRVWKRVPSTTQCISGTREAYLTITEDYAICPHERAFSVTGTMHHARLEAVAKALNFNELSEEFMDGEVTGILDRLVPDADKPDHYELWDYKNIGSFKIAKALGIVATGMIDDPSGELYKSKSKYGAAGTVKQIKVFGEDESQADMEDYVLQINHYRLKIEALGFPVSKMIIQAMCRDYGLATAKSRGVTSQFYLMPVKRMDDSEVLDYFKTKAVALLSALESGSMPNPCSEKERWDGRKCQGYCDVVSFCPEGLAIKNGEVSNDD